MKSHHGGMGLTYSEEEYETAHNRWHAAGSNGFPVHQHPDPTDPARMQRLGSPIFRDRRPDGNARSDTLAEERKERLGR